MRARITPALGALAGALSLVLALGAPTAAAQPPAVATPPDSLLTVAYAPALGVDLEHSRRLQGGVYARDVRAGRGDTVRSFATLTLRFRIRLPDGTAVGDEGPQVGRWLPGTYLRGVEIGLRGMRAGGRRQLVIPPMLAYGEHGPPGVPAGAPLVVDVELLRVS